jgi:glucose/arabinose dehydrogenase
VTAIDPAAAPTEIARVESPTDLAWREGDPALYVTEQGGRVIRLGAGDPAVVLDMRDLTDADGERGLLGLAFAPAGDVAYVNYTDGNGDTVIAEHPVQPDGTFLTGDSSRTVLQIDQPYGNHNGGDLAFGPDGYLYIATGDGGGGGDPERRANDLTSLLGKILRIDPAIGAGQPYTVPEDNPFAGTDAAGEIWALGLRNPWRFSFDRETGDLWIADVGASAVEEVNAVAAIEGFDAGRGRNFGWSAFEGTERFHDDVVVEDHTPPLYTYGHDEGCSIAGGVRARGAGAGSLAGWYVFADYCAGAVWALEIAATPDGFSAGRRLTVAEGIASPTAVVEGPQGEVYVLSKAGAVYRLDPAA